MRCLSIHRSTMLGTAVWSAIKEAHTDHLQIIEDLLNAGARIDAANYPTGHDGIDALLKARLEG